MKIERINSARTPVYRDSGFDLSDAMTTSGAFATESGNEQRDPGKYIYSRYRNPTVVSAENMIMETEGCNWALLTQSGMSAIDTALSIFQEEDNKAPWLFFSEIYGGTISYIESILRRRRGVDARYFRPAGEKYELSDLERTLEEVKPSVLYLETVSNPMLMVADIPEIVKTAKRSGCRILVDNTFATPYLFRPLDFGADLVIHSGTKYFSGHGNITAGIICGNDSDLLQKALEYRKFIGHMLSPDDAYRLETQMMTFSLRFRHQCRNASQLASFLAESDVVGKTWYPGLQGHPTHDVAEKLFEKRGYGAMITFDLKGRDADSKRIARDRFMELVADHILLIPTLGDPRTILMPVEAVWGAKYPEPGMIRLSVGYEDYDILLRKVADALGSL